MALLNPNSSCWTPPGTIRAVLAVGSLVGLVVGCFLQLPMEYVGLLAGLANAAMGFYFAKKTNGTTP